MRRLSARQAVSCEKATGPRCRCRCLGALHGASRTSGGEQVDTESYLRTLPEEDPHHLKPWIQLPLPKLAVA